jgi:hypothetical protein
VFLEVGHGKDSKEDKKAKALLMDKATPSKGHEETIALKKQERDDDYSISDPKYALSGPRTFINHLQALFLKRFFIYRRNLKGLVIEVLIPVLLVIIGLGFSKVQFFVTQPERMLTTDQLPF